MKKKTGIVLVALLAAGGSALANFSGGDDFNDNSMNASKWTLHHAENGTTLSETSQHLGANILLATAEDEGSSAWSWIGNRGSYTEDWTVVYTTTDLTDVSNYQMESETWFGFLVMFGSFDNSFAIDRGGEYWGSMVYDLGCDGSVDGTEVVDVGRTISSGAVVFKMAFDASSKMLYAWYDAGSGFVLLGSMSATGWGMTDSDEFDLAVYGGGYNVTIAPTELYGDNLVLTPSFIGEALGNHVDEIEIGAGYALEEGMYEVEFELEAMDWHSIASVSVAAPFGSFECEQDWSEWEYEHAVPASGTLPDADGDGVNNLAEFRAGTNPTNAASRFVVSAGANTSGSGFKLEWTPVANREYAVYWSTNLTAGFELIASKLTVPQGSYVDAAHVGQAQGYYYVGVDRVNTNADAVQNMEIQVDGNTADWNGQQPQFVDPAGDSSIYSGLDITGITLAKGSSDLFVKVDRAGTTRPAGKYSNIWIYLKADGENTDYSIELFHDGTSSRDARLFDSSSQDYASYIMLSDSLSFNDSGSSIEIAIPLSQLSLVDHYAVSCYTHSMENWEWTNNGEEEDNRAVIVMPY